MKRNSVAILVSTYNSPEALNLFLLSVVNQQLLPDEILIADDGSTPETKELIDSFRSRIASTIHHVWHEDLGFRKTVILNKALAKCTADYIIQIDGDCILHPKTVGDHLRFAEKGTYVYGTRIHIKIDDVPNVIAKEKVTFSFFYPSLHKRLRRLHIPFLGMSAKQENKVSSKLRGCNMAFWREDVIAINGFNEALKGWGRSDSELAIRFHNYGLKTKRLKFMGFVYHLDHIENDKSKTYLNNEVQERTKKEGVKWAESGLDKYVTS